MLRLHHVLSGYMYVEVRVLKVVYSISGASPTNLDVISGAPPGSVWQRLAVVACEEFDAGMLKVTAVTKKSEFTYILA